MNKTVNINLAGTFFHIDEDAYGKLQRYLAAIRRSFQGVQGEDEIIADIEARIGELFNERIKEPRQVISISDLDQVIAIMGQPEDYAVDEDIFEDTTSTSYTKRKKSDSSKKLYRDTDNAYIGGVSSGFGHYLNIDPLWIRLGWIGVVLLGFGSPILLYILLWVLVPEAATTADKLEMKGKAVNIDNIQQKVKEGFENVADSVRNADIGNKAKKGASSFFSGLGAAVMMLLRVIGKFIGILLIIIGATTVIGLFVGLISAGTIDIFDGAFADIPIQNDTGLPLWLASILVLFAVGIPFFFLFYLGLKIVSSNLRSMPLAAKLSLLGLWIISSVVLGVFVVREATLYAYDGNVKDRVALTTTANDTLRIMMRGSEAYDIPLGRSNNYFMEVNSDGQRVALMRNVRLIVRATSEPQAYMRIERRAHGRGYEQANEEAASINYNHELIDNTLYLDGYFTWDKESRYTSLRHSDKEVRVIVYLPEGAILYADDNTYSYHRNDSRYRDILDNKYEEEYMLVEGNELICLSCPDDDAASRSSKSRTRAKRERSSNSNWRRTGKPDWEDDTYDRDRRTDKEIRIKNDSIDLKIKTNN